MQLDQLLSICTAPIISNVCLMLTMKIKTHTEKTKTEKKKMCVCTKRYEKREIREMVIYRVFSWDLHLFTYKIMSPAYLYNKPSVSNRKKAYRYIKMSIQETVQNKILHIWNLSTLITTLFIVKLAKLTHSALVQKYSISKKLSGVHLTVLETDRHRYFKGDFGIAGCLQHHPWNIRAPSCFL